MVLIVDAGHVVHYLVEYDLLYVYILHVVVCFPFLCLYMLRFVGVAYRLLYLQEGTWAV